MANDIRQRLDRAELARLAFWSKNIDVLGDAGRHWPGFAYGAAEQTRMSALARDVDDDAFGKFKFVTVVTFIALAALGIVAIFIPIASLLFPIPAQTPTAAFVLLLAATAFAIIGIGLPLSMRFAALVSTGERMRSSLEAADGDRALARKVAFQIGRVMAIMCGVFVPGTLLWIAFHVESSPLVSALKWVSYAALAAAAIYSVRIRLQ